MQLKITVCVCMRARGVGLQGSTMAPPARGLGMQGPRPERVQVCPLCLFSRRAAASWASEGLSMDSTGAVLFVLLFGHPHLLKRVQ